MYFGDPLAAAPGMDSPATPTQRTFVEDGVLSPQSPAVDDAAAPGGDGTSAGASADDRADARATREEADARAAGSRASDTPSLCEDVRLVVEMACGRGRAERRMGAAPANGAG